MTAEVFERASRRSGQRKGNLVTSAFHVVSGWRGNGESDANLSNVCDGGRWGEAAFSTPRAVTGRLSRRLGPISARSPTHYVATIS